MGRFLNGLSYNFKGLGYFKSHKSLWKFIVIPLCINIVLMAVLMSVYLNYFDSIFAFMSAPLGGLDVVDPSNILWTILDGGLWVVRHLLMFVFFILTMVLLMVLVFFVGSLINSPFYELMAEKILILEKQREDVPFEFKTFIKDLKFSLGMELAKLLLFFSCSSVLFLLSFIPVVGLVASLVGFLFTAWVFAFGLSTYPMVLERKKFSEIFGWARQNKLALIGFGVPSMIPVVGLLIISFQVVGGTLYFIENAPEKTS